MAPTLPYSREDLDALSDDELSSFVAAKQVGDFDTLNSILIDARRRGGLSDTAQIEMYGQDVQTPTEALGETQATMASVGDVVRPAALAVVGGALGGSLGAAAGLGRLGVATSTALGDVGANYLYDTLETGEFGGEAARNAGTNAALNLATMGAGGLLRRAFPSGRPERIAEAAQPTAVFDPFLGGETPQSLAKNVELEKVAKPLTKAGFFSYEKGLPTNYADPDSLRMTIKQEGISPAQRLFTEIDPSIRTPTAVIKAAATTPEALRPLIESRDLVVDALDNVYEAAKVANVPLKIEGVKPQSLFSETLLDKIHRWDASTFSRAKATLAQDTAGEILSDLKRLSSAEGVELSNPEGLVDWMRWVANRAQPTSSGRVILKVDELPELSPKQAQQLYQNAQEFLRDAGQYDLKNLAAIMQGNRKHLTPVVELSQEVARDVVNNLGTQLGRMEGQARLLLSQQPELAPELAQTILSKPDNYVANANQFYHSLATAHKTMQLERARLGLPVKANDAVGGTAFNRIGEATLGKVERWITPEKAALAQASEGRFKQAALMADIQLNPDKYAAQGSYNIAKNIFATAVPEMISAASSLLGMGAPSQDPLSRSTADLFKDPQGSARKVYDTWVARGDPNRGIAEAGMMLQVIKDHTIPYQQKKIILDQMVKRNAPPTTEGFTEVVNGKHTSPYEQSEQLKYFISNSTDLKEEARNAAAIMAGEYVPTDEGYTAPPFVALEPSPPIDLERLEGSLMGDYDGTFGSQVGMGSSPNENLVEKFTALATGTDRERY